jgi:ligand-binding sensor domain-containing protein
MNSNKQQTLFQLYCLTILLTFFTSCNGQLNTTTQVVNPVASSVTIQPKASQSIIQDHNDDIWFCDSIGVTVFNPSTSKFKQYSEKDGLSSNRINSILEDDKGKIWLATANGITTYENGKFSILATPISSGNLNFIKAGSNVYGNLDNNINCILQDSKGNLWFGYQKGITNLMVKSILISQ